MKQTIRQTIESDKQIKKQGHNQFIYNLSPIYVVDYFNFCEVRGKQFTSVEAAKKHIDKIKSNRSV